MKALSARALGNVCIATAINYICFHEFSYAMVFPFSAKTIYSCMLVGIIEEKEPWQPHSGTLQGRRELQAV